jgi:hypothetical protein
LAGDPTAQPDRPVRPRHPCPRAGRPSWQPGPPRPERSSDPVPHLLFPARLLQVAPPPQGGRSGRCSGWRLVEARRPRPEAVRPEPLRRPGLLGVAVPSWAPGRHWCRPGLHPGLIGRSRRRLRSLNLQWGIGRHLSNLRHWSTTRGRRRWRGTNRRGRWRRRWCRYFRCWNRKPLSWVRRVGHRHRRRRRNQSYLPQTRQTVSTAGSGTAPQSFQNYLGQLAGLLPGHPSRKRQQQIASHRPLDSRSDRRAGHFLVKYLRSLGVR